MPILTIFKSRSSKSKANKLSISAPVAVAAVPLTTQAVPSSSASSMGGAAEPARALANDSALTAPVQVFKGNPKFMGKVTNNNTTQTNTNNTNMGNVNSNITGDVVTINPGINEMGIRPVKMLFSSGPNSPPEIIRNSLTIERNGEVEQTIYLDDFKNGMFNPDFVTNLEQRMRACGIAEPIIAHTIGGLQLALQMPALQEPIPVSA